MPKNTTEMLAEEAKHLASNISNKVGEWIDDLVAQASDHTPDSEAVRTSAERAVKDVTTWLEDLPTKVGSLVPVPAKKQRSRSTAKAVVAGAAIGSAVVYFFDPNEGKRRRDRIVTKVKGWFGMSVPRTTTTPSFSSPNVTTVPEDASGT